MWFWKDHATGEGGNAFHLLLRAGMGKEEAAELIKARADQPAPTPATRSASVSRAPARGLTPREEALLRAAQGRLDEGDIRGRGITLEQAWRVGLGRSREGDLLIPILGPDGKPQAIKARLRHPQEFRYRYLTPGRGAPAWFSPGFATQRTIPFGTATPYTERTIPSGTAEPYTPRPASKEEEVGVD
jgi:putative DNA primase/helicase